MMIDFGVAQHVEARAAGNPGQRTFHLRVLGEADQSASLKLEKEHMLGLGNGLREILAQLKYEGQPEAAGVVSFPPTPEHDFPVGRLDLGLLKSDQAIVIQAHELAERRGGSRS